LDISSGRDPSIVRARSWEGGHADAYSPQGRAGKRAMASEGSA
jgi:hypothetical protein